MKKALLISLISAPILWATFVLAHLTNVTIDEWRAERRAETAREYLNLVSGSMSSRPMVDQWQSADGNRTMRLVGQTQSGGGNYELFMKGEKLFYVTTGSSGKIIEWQLVK
jgi:hypothetical protein